jgi:hypothetical protein
MAKSVSFYTPEGQKKEAEIERQMMMAQMLMGAQQAQRTPTRFTPRESPIASLAPALMQSVGMLQLQKGQKGMEELRAQEMAALLQKMGGGTPGAPGSAPAGPTKSELNPSGLDPTLAAQAYMADPAKYAGALMELKKPTELGRNIEAAGFTPEQTASAYGEALLPKPDKGTDDMREYAKAREQGYQGTLEQWILSGKRAGATNFSMNTEKSLYTNLGENQAKAYSELYGQAQAAPETIARTKRVRELLAQTPYTGAAAEWKLAVGKGAKALGFDYTGDDVQNTELLARELGQNALDSVKSSGLAGSQGLTEGERKFLMQVIGGTIELDNKTLGRVAELNERVARNSVKKWNDTYGRLDANQMRTLGMTPVELPKDEPAKPAAAPAAQQRKSVGGKTYVKIDGQWFEEG